MNTDRQDFTSEDIRFTTQDHALYAIALGWPSSPALRVHSLYKANPYLQGAVCSVQLLGSKSTLHWTQKQDGLYVELPRDQPQESAFAFRILEAGDSRCSSPEQRSQSGH